MIFLGDPFGGYEVVRGIYMDSIEECECEIPTFTKIYDFQLILIKNGNFLKTQVASIKLLESKQVLTARNL
jgi:hypothetical protein